MKLEQFIRCTGAISNVEMEMLDSAREVFTRDEMANYEARGLFSDEYWVPKLYGLLRRRAAELYREVYSPIPTDLTKPLLRVIDCLKCGQKMKAIQPQGACCYGMPRCPSCGHEIHEANCRGVRK